MTPQNYHSVFAGSADWNVNLARAELSSPSKDDVSAMIILDGSTGDLKLENGAISASVTALEGQWDPNLNHPFRECGFVFRYHDPEHFYVAGMGGFAKRFYIARVSGSDWRFLAGSEEPAASLEFNWPYDLRVEFESDRIILFHGSAEVSKAVDNAYASGSCGLRTNRTRGRFQNVDIKAQSVKKKCFVIMPFDSKLSRVYNVIKQTVELSGIECLRADETYDPKAIMEKVRDQIATADLVVIDFTNRNPNVYYEAGLAEAWKKTCIRLAQSKDDLAIDVQHFDTIMYSDIIGGDKELRESLNRALKQIFKTSTSTT